MKTFLGLLFLMMPIVVWSAVLGYILGIKMMLLLVVITAGVVFSFLCKIIGRIILAS